MYIKGERINSAVEFIFSMNIIENHFWYHIQWCSLLFWQDLFFIQNTHSCESRKPPKHVKFINFSSIDVLECLSMSFGYKITSGFEVTSTSHQSWKYEKISCLKGRLQPSNLTTWNSQTTRNFVDKTHWVTSCINKSWWI